MYFSPHVVLLYKKKTAKVNYRGLPTNVVDSLGVGHGSWGVGNGRWGMGDGGKVYRE